MYKLFKIPRVCYPYLQKLIRNYTSANGYKFPLDNKPSRYVILRVYPKDYEEVVKLFWSVYAKDEPTMIAAGLNIRYSPVLEDRLVCYLCQGLSFMTKCRSTGQVIGASVNTADALWDADLNDKIADGCICKGTRDILKFHSFVTRQPNIFCKYCQDKVYRCTYIMTDRDNRRHKVAKNLVITSQNDARDQGYQVYRMDTTNEPIANLCRNVGMTQVWEMPYKKYVGPDGTQILFPPDPYAVIRCFVDFPKGYNCRETFSRKPPKILTDDSRLDDSFNIK